ncbi:MAG: hypothetical protein HQ581_12910, partial [Planctomycetes bacterium]|nr:hypothetical protein [Planctomycetota bacterium]
MTIGPEMRQRLLELIHDLLSEDEEAELRERIDRDPQLARAYEEVRATADAMSEAARVEAPPIELRRPEDRDPAIGASLPSGTGKRRVSEAPPPARAARWTVGITAAVLLLVSLGGYLSHRSRMSTIAAAHPRLLVTGPSHIGVETDSRFSITTSGATGEPMAAEIEFLLQGPGDRQIFAHHESTDEEGRLDVVVPAADVREASSGSPAGASLTVLAVSGDRRAQCEGLLRLEPLGYQTDLSPGKSSYRPGDEVTYQSSTVSRLTLTASRAFPVTFTIIDPRGNDVSRQQTTTEAGVARGKTRLRDDAPAGQYRLSVTSADVALPQRSCIFWVRDALDGEAGADVEFRRERFRPGQEVTADFSLGPVDGIPAAGVAVRTTVRLAGEVVDEQTAETSADGTLRIAFTLPKEIHRAGATLAITFDRQGTSRTLVREIPLDLGHLQVSFYPEGGQLAAGLENRVYFMARDGHGEPVDLKGVIVDAQG